MMVGRRDRDRQFSRANPRRRADLARSRPAARRPFRDRRPRTPRAAGGFARPCMPAKSSAIAGVAGNGQRQLSEVLTGLRAPSAGTIRLDGRPITAGRCRRLRRLRDRPHSGGSPPQRAGRRSQRHRQCRPARIQGRRRLAQGGLLPPEGGRAARPRDRHGRRRRCVPDFNMPIRNLSGGNQQRLVARREMRVASRVLVAAYPSRGLDVGAINTMLRYLVELRDKGVAVVLISEELEELLNLSDRIAVLVRRQGDGHRAGRQCRHRHARPADGRTDAVMSQEVLRRTPAGLRGSTSWRLQRFPRCPVRDRDRVAVRRNRPRARCSPA